MDKKTLFFWFCITYFFVFCLAGLSSLGLHYDEAHVGLGAADIIDSFGSKTLSGIHLPLMQDYYTGFTKDFITIPFQFLLGNTVFALRFARVFWAFAAVLCVYFTTKRWFGSKTALITLFLLCCNSVFIRCVRTGQRRDELMQMLFVWLCLGLLEVFRKRHNGFIMFLAGMSLGVAVWAKISTFGTLAGWGLFVIIASPYAWRFIRKNIFTSIKYITLFLTGCISGALPLIAHNIVYEFETIPRMLEVFSSSGTGNNMLGSIIERMQDLAAFLSGTSMLETLKAYPTPFVPLLATVAVIMLLKRMVTKKPDRINRKMMFILISAAVAFMSSVFAPRYKDAEHMLLMFPYIQIAIALALAPLCTASLSRSVKTLLICVVFAGLISETTSLTQTIKAANAKQGKGWFSTIPGDVTTYMQANNIPAAISLVPMLGPGVEFLSNRTISVKRDWNMFFEGNGKEAFFDNYMKNTPEHYLFRQEKTIEDLTAIDQFAEFEKMNAALGRKYNKQAQFKSGSGSMLIGLYKSAPTAASVAVVNTDTKTVDSF